MILDLRLGVGVQVDALGVAAALDVEDAVLTPPVLVVADEGPMRVRGQRRLPCAYTRRAYTYVTAATHMSCHRVSGIHSRSWQLRYSYTR
jgi:hypothetical protein